MRRGRGNVNELRRAVHEAGRGGAGAEGFGQRLGALRAQGPGSGARDRAGACGAGLGWPIAGPLLYG